MDSKKNFPLFYYPKRFVQTLLLTIITVAVVGVCTVYFSSFVDYIVQKEIVSKIIWIGLAGYMLLQCVMMLINYLYQAGVAYIRSSICINLRDQITDTIFTKLSLQNYWDIGADHITSILINDLKSLRMQCIDAQISLVRIITRLALFIGITFYFHGLLGLLILILLPVLYFISQKCNQKMEKWGEKQAAEREAYLANYQDYLNIRKDAKYAGADDFLGKKIKQTNQQLEEVVFQCSKARVDVQAMHTLSRNITRCAVIGLELVLGMCGQLSVGAILSTISIFSLIEDEVSAAQATFQILAESKPVIARVYSVLSAQGNMQRFEEHCPIEGWATLGLRVSFKAFNRFVLDGADVVFYRGKKHLLVGKSGSGKSTILKIMLGIYKDYSGCVWVDGHKLEQGTEQLMDLVAYLDQNFYIFQDSIENNIFFGLATHYKNLENCGFSSILNRYIPDLKKEVTKNGSNLSGGQRQIIGIARALASGKEVLMLDESFSALDEIVFLEVLHFLQNMREITLIVVSHRKQDVGAYDVVYEVLKGKVYEQGVP